MKGLIRQPSGYHPYEATITLRLREGRTRPVGGGTRVTLVSAGSRNAVLTSIQQDGGPMLCSGTGTEALPDGPVGYLETKAGRTTYQITVPRAFRAFACGENRRIEGNRVVVIGTGDHVVAEVETRDPDTRTVVNGSIMNGSFRSRATRGAARYEYQVTWAIERGP